MCGIVAIVGRNGVGKTTTAVNTAAALAAMKRRVLLIDLESVCCIKADGRYSTVYTDSEDYFCNLPISELDRRLDARFFFRVHRSHLVNLRFAKSFEKIDDQCFVVMDHKEGVKVPISRNKVNELKEMLGLT